MIGILKYKEKYKNWILRKVDVRHCEEERRSNLLAISFYDLQSINIQADCFVPRNDAFLAFGVDSKSGIRKINNYSKNPSSSEVRKLKDK